MQSQQDSAPSLMPQLLGRIISESWGTASLPFQIPILAALKQTTLGTNQLLQAMFQSWDIHFPAVLRSGTGEVPIPEAPQGVQEDGDRTVLAPDRQVCLLFKGVPHC